ncbi:hypothetical protein QL285_046229 [Trifolium repens]|nr:hypothetical protein QL285_046229 [Trifolium repens]
MTWITKLLFKTETELEESIIFKESVAILILGTSSLVMFFVGLSASMYVPNLKPTDMNKASPHACKGTSKQFNQIIRWLETHYGDHSSNLSKQVHHHPHRAHNILHFLLILLYVREGTEASNF